MGASREFEGKKGEECNRQKSNVPYGRRYGLFIHGKIYAEGQCQSAKVVAEGWTRGATPTLTKKLPPLPQKNTPGRRKIFFKKGRA